MHRTISLPYVVEDAGFAGVLSELRRRQSRVIRSAYNRLVEGIALKDLYQNLRAHAVGQGLHTWLLLSAMTKAKALYQMRPEGGVVFGGKKGLIDRTRDKMDPAEWKKRRLAPLVIEGHARSYGSQGGNHLATLDMTNTRLVLHAPGRDFILKLKLSCRSREYRRRLECLQARSEALRDVPFSVSVTETTVAIGWKDPGTVSKTGRSDRVLAIDLNPNRIGWAVVEKIGDHRCRSVAWGLFEYPELNRRLGLASDDPKVAAQDNKRQHELSILAKRLVLIARHCQASWIVTEHLSLPFRSKKGKVNRLVNRCWYRTGFVQCLVRRLEEAGLRHGQVDPAYSSMIGNSLWADLLKVPDPACAALEVGRRFLNPLARDAQASVPKPNAVHLWKDGRRVPERRTLGRWSQVWKELNKSAGDTPRRVRRRSRADFPFGPPRRPSIRETRSKVGFLDPRPGTSEPFGTNFSLLLAG